MHFIGEDYSSSQANITTDSIDAAFSHFVDDMFDILNQEDFGKVQRKCLENVNVIGGIKLSRNVKNRIHNSKNLSGLFIVLCNRKSHWNWMNIRMLEKLAGNSSEAKKLIKDYKNQIFSRKVKDVISDISNLEIHTDGYTEVKEKWNKDFNDLTIADVVKRWDDIEKKLNVGETMLLKSINEGCVEVCWLLPDHLSKDTISLATNSQHLLSTSTQELFPEMLYLKIGDVIIKNDVISKFCFKYVKHVPYLISKTGCNSYMVYYLAFSFINEFILLNQYLGNHILHRYYYFYAI